MDIYFQGLMVHTAKVDHSGIHVAYLMPADGHNPLLSIDDEFLTDKTTAPGQPGTGSGGAGTKATCFGLSGRIWTDMGVRPVDLAPLQGLLSLRNDFKGGGVDKVGSGPVATTPYFELPQGGGFTFPNYFRCQVAFESSGDDARCVPRTVQLHVDLPPERDVKFMISNPLNRVVVHGDGVVWITNTCSKEQTEECSLTQDRPLHLPKTPHTDAYKYFYQPTSQVRPPLRGMACTSQNTKELAAPKCGGGGRTLDIDCASSRFP